MRDLTPEMIAECESGGILPIIIAELAFDSGTLYMWSGIGTLYWNGNDYMGGGNLIAVSSIEETQKLEAKGIVVSLSGIPTTLISVALSERTRGRAFRMWLAASDDQPDSVGDISPDNLIFTPYRIFTGLMDVMEWGDDGKTGTIRLSVESSMLLGQRSKIQRYTSEDQKKLYPADEGLDLIPQLQDKEVVW